MRYIFAVTVLSILLSDAIYIGRSALPAYGWSEQDIEDHNKSLLESRFRYERF